MVIVSVTLFLAAIVGVSMFLLYPHDPETPQEARAADETRERFDPIEYMRRPTDLPRLTLREADPEEDVIIVYGERDVAPVRPEDEELRVPEIREPEPEPEPAPRPKEPEPEKRVPERPRERPEERPEPEARPTPPEPAPRPEPEARPTPPEPEPEPEPRRERVTEYWIQVISSPTRDTIERARTRLDQRDLGTRVTTTTVNGSTFYRLRIGPYRRKAEAEKFLDIVSGLDGFEGSYISEEYPLRTVTR